MGAKRHEALDRLAGGGTPAWRSKPALAAYACAAVALVLVAHAGGSVSDPGAIEFSGGDASYAVVIDAGSTGSRVHVFTFADGGSGPVLQDEMFEALKPGLKEYALDPEKAAASLDPLLEKAIAKVPEEKRAVTPLTLRATAGLRLLPEGQAAATAILEKVQEKLQATPFNVPDEHVSILDGSDEGAYGWITVNYLLGKLGGAGEDTVAVVDLGGGSMQMMFAVDEEVKAAAPEGYVRDMEGGGETYPTYVHSYLGYGIMAARARILKTNPDAAGTHPCVPAGFEGGCEGKCYGLQPTDSYVAKARSEGASAEECLAAATAALQKDAACPTGDCTFAGSWSPKRTTPIYAMSYLYERAEQSKAATPATESAMMTVTPADYRKALDDVCATPYDEILKKFPEAEEDHYPYLCLDVAYIYALFTEGFGLADDEVIHLVDKIEYQKKHVEAAWALGDAIATM